jgi:signal transduction histidine kinase
VSTPQAVEITIDDDGPGIPDAELANVFQPFYRVEGSRSRETGGIGLGLAIALSVVLGHGGELTLSNRPEGGLRARIGLPV